MGLRAAGPFDRIGFRGPLDWRQGVDLADTEAVRAHLLGMFEGFDEGLRDLMRYNGGAFINRPVACRRALAPLSKREGVVRHGVGTVALR
ncbi:hypothetical protein [Streptomyces noursei]|uniref:hypothetical protein n=1 Tax=Streptomyces noursei TaxID=1971 RepID=UPI0030F0CED4